MMDGDDEAYLLLLLSDGNLPTGSFVASAGLESFVTHGFFASSAPGGKQKDKLEVTVDFVRDNLSSYSRSALAFVSDAHQLVHAMVEPMKATEQVDSAIGDSSIDDTLQRLAALDALYETTTLNHAARRASRTQGVALLSLYSKGFAKPAAFCTTRGADKELSTYNGTLTLDSVLTKLVDGLKLSARREETYGHLPICWGVLTAALGLSLARSQFLHLFLYARGLISAGVRMNILGPYAAQQLLLHSVRPIVNAETERCSCLRTGLCCSDQDGRDVPEIKTLNGPAMTWPLGEILAARHDLQHSRIFNS